MSTIRHSRRVDRLSIEAAVTRGLRHKAARTRMQELRGLILGLLGRDKQLFVEFEQLAQSIATEREQAFLDLGFEHGGAAAYSKQIRDASGVNHSKTADWLAAAIRERIIGAGLPLAEAILVLVESAWIVALGFKDDEVAS